MLIRTRVRLALEIVKLVELISLALEPDTRNLVRQVGLVSIPAQLPGDDDVNETGPTFDRQHRHLRDTKRARDSRHRAAVLRAVEDVDRRCDSLLDAGRDRVNVAGLAWLIARPPPRLVTAGPPARSRSACGGPRLGVGAPVEVGHIPVRRQLGAPGAQPSQQRTPSIRTPIARVEGGHRTLAHPAFVQRARRAQLAHRAAVCTIEVYLRPFAAQKRSPADLAGRVRQGRPNVPGTHCNRGYTSCRAAELTVDGWSSEVRLSPPRAPPWPRPQPSMQGAPGPPRSAGTPS